MSELLPCPFCGKDPKCSTNYRGEPGEHIAVAISFECPEGCSVSRDKPTYDEAVTAWNTRAPQSREPAPSAGSPASAVTDDWQDDPSADERWNAGLDFGQQQLCKYLGVDPDDVTWDAATEELEGDVQAVIGNIMRAKFGEDWTPSDGTIYAAVSRAGVTDAEHGDMMRAIDAKLGDLASSSTATLREQFEHVITALNYDGNDTDSLTVGEIRRALP